MTMVDETDQQEPMVKMEKVEKKDLSILKAPRTVVRVKDVGELFDDLIHALGGYGTYQRRITFFMILPLFFFVAFINNIMAYVVSAPSDFFCSLPELRSGPLSVLTSPNGPDLRYSLMPYDTSSTNSRSSCQMWNINYTASLLQHNYSMSSLTDFLNNTHHNYTTVSCPYGWEYTHNINNWDASVVTEWDLVCDWSHSPTVGWIFVVLAFVLGVVVGGFCADKWGRKKTFFVSLFVFIVFGLSSAFAPNYTAFVMLAMIHSFGSGPLYYILYALGVENLSWKHRVTYVVWLSVIYALGGMAYILVAYFLRHWRNMTIVGTAPFFLLFIYVFFLPESPRWLLVHERFEAVENYFRNISRINGHPFDERCQNKLKTIFLQCQREVNIEHHKMSRWERAAWTRLFATAPMRRKTLLLLYLMCTLEICYSGLRRYSPSFTGIGADEYFNSFVNFLVEIPGYVLTALLCDRLGRRVTLLILFGAAFVSCLLSLAFPSGPNNYWGVIAVFLIAKIFYAGAYIVGELLVYETFPTVIRLQGVALVESIAYLISHIGALIVILQDRSLVLPLVIFGCLGLIAMLCVFVLPETVSMSLPETVEEADMRGAFYRAAANLRVPEFKKKTMRFSAIYKKPDSAENEVMTTTEMKEIVDDKPIKPQPEVVTRPWDEVYVKPTKVDRSPVVRFQDNKHNKDDSPV